jgi:hypothetical protein
MRGSGMAFPARKPDLRIDDNVPNRSGNWHFQMNLSAKGSVNRAAHSSIAFFQQAGRTHYHETGNKNVPFGN